MCAEILYQQGIAILLGTSRLFISLLNRINWGSFPEYLGAAATFSAVVVALNSNRIRYSFTAYADAGNEKKELNITFINKSNQKMMIQFFGCDLYRHRINLGFKSWNFGRYPKYRVNCDYSKNNIIAEPNRIHIEKNNFGSKLDVHFKQKYVYVQLFLLDSTGSWVKSRKSYKIAVDRICFS